MTYYVGNHQMQQGEQTSKPINNGAAQERGKSREGGENAFADQAEKKAKEKQRQQS